ncbi:hypothetical protein Sjap_017294 [Stephania japonica]|uniref:Protein kinase domain-containing protein n=1 Tax=Stephania japonica TaxID=461633 RepID=A0AAP0I5W8_9MAGN
MVGFRAVMALLALLQFLPNSTSAGCPLDLSGSNFTLVASACSNQGDRGKCCRYINAVIAISVSIYANSTSSLGVPAELSDACLRSVSETLELYGVPPNATVFCGLGTKIPFNYKCKGRTTVMQMLRSPKFEDVLDNCKLPLSEEISCKRCLNAGIAYLHRQVGLEDNVTLSTCRDATYATLASQSGNISAVDIASCFFQVPGLVAPSVVTSEPSPPPLPPQASSNSTNTESPSQLLMGIDFRGDHHPYHLTIVPAIGIAITGTAVMLLIVMIYLIRRKSRELENIENPDVASRKAFSSWTSQKFQEGRASTFRRFTYDEIKEATKNFSIIIGQGGYGTVYKAQFSDGFVAAVKRMNKVPQLGKDDFSREMEILGRLHHRHLVALRGFCVKSKERFLLYEYMENGSLKDHLHFPGRTPLSWRARVQIAIDVAYALEYLHFYCDPPLFHRDIKSSNILLDENFVAKLADFGLAYASKSAATGIESVDTDIRGTPGYMDPEYVVTQELTEKSDIYSYGVVLLELMTSRKAIQDNRNLVEWSQIYMATESRLHELLDPVIRDSYNMEQLQTIVMIVKWCTQKEGRSRPSIRQVLRMLYESSDPMHSGFIRAVENDDYEGLEGAGRASGGSGGRGETIYHSGDARYLPSSSSTSRSYCSRSLLLETGSPQSPPGL